MLFPYFQFKKFVITNFRLMFCYEYYKLLWIKIPTVDYSACCIIIYRPISCTLVDILAAKRSQFTLVTQVRGLCMNIFPSKFCHTDNVCNILCLRRDALYSIQIYGEIYYLSIIYHTQEETRGLAFAIEVICG